MYQFRKDVQFMCGFAGYYGAGDFNREEVVDQMGERLPTADLTAREALLMTM